jgi:general secretion pathway protein J
MRLAPVTAAVGPRRLHERGFTLVEMLVCLAILGLVAGMLLAGLGMTGTVAARASVRDADLDEVTTAQMILRGRLERLRAVTRLDSSEPIVDAQGTAGDFSFIAPPFDRAGPDALQRYRILLNATGDLVLYSASGLDDRIDLHARELSGWTPTKLLGGVASLSIGYFGADRNNRGRRWQSFWNSHPQPPDLVRIRIGFPPGDRRSWPDLVVRPRSTINALCRIDALSGRCESAS